MSNSGRLVAVTGATQGVGLELARIFVARGDRVVICGRDDARLEAARSQLGDDVIAVRCDVGDEADRRAFAARLEELGGVEVLINNAAIQLNYLLADRKTDELLADIDREFAIDLIGPIHLVALCLPQLRAKPDTAVVNVTSGLGLVPKRSAAVYCASKAGLHAFSTSLRHQLRGTSGPHMVDAVLPLVDTAMTQGRGSGKITAEQAAREIVRALDRRAGEAHIGKIKLLVAIQRLSPRLAESIMGRR